MPTSMSEDKLINLAPPDTAPYHELLALWHETSWNPAVTCLTLKIASKQDRAALSAFCLKVSDSSHPQFQVR
ncbi:hypothetical protein WJX77_009164 [Trebouxia sp. C0004]